MSEQGEWLGHAWNEVFVGEWVPVDATWLEVGSLDATHIEMLKSNDKPFGNNLSVLMKPGTQIDWRNANVLGLEVQAVQPARIELAQPERNFTLALASPVLPPGGETVAWLEFPPSDYRVVEAILEPCKGASAIVSVEDKERALITRPGEKASAAWRVRASPSLSHSFIYTCPLLLNSPILEERPVELRVEPGAPLASLDAWPASNQLLPGSEQTIFLKIKSGSPSKIGIATEEGALLSSAPHDGSVASISYIPRSLGPQKVFAFTDQGGVVELRFNVTSNLTLSIANLSFSPRVLEGKLAQANASLFLNSSAPASVRLSLSLDNESARQSSSFNGTSSFSLSVPATIPGPRELVLVIESDGTRIEQRKPIRVIEKPDISIQSVSPPSEGHAVVLSLSFTGEPKDVVVAAEGQRASLREGEMAATLRLFPGMRNITIAWSDELGNAYQKSEEVWVPSGQPPCLPATLMLSLVFLYGLFKRAL